jgi:hypothetical protein
MEAAQDSRRQVWEVESEPRGGEPKIAGHGHRADARTPAIHEGLDHGNRATKSAAEVEDGERGASRAPPFHNLEIPSCQATCRPYRPPTEAKSQEVIRRHRRTLQSSKTRSTTMRPKRAIPRTSNKIKQIRVSFEAGGKVSRYISRGIAAPARSATGSWRVSSPTVAAGPSASAHLLSRRRRGVARQRAWFPSGKRYRTPVAGRLACVDHRRCARERAAPAAS